MWYNKKEWIVIRNTTTDPGTTLQKKVWQQVGTIEGTYMPMGPSDAMRNNQYFADVKGSIVCEPEYAGEVLAMDEVIGPDGERYAVKSVVVYDNVIPHVTAYVKDVQSYREYT